MDEPHNSALNSSGKPVLAGSISKTTGDRWALVPPVSVVAVALFVLAGCVASTTEQSAQTDTVAGETAGSTAVSPEAAADGEADAEKLAFAASNANSTAAPVDEVAEARADGAPAPDDSTDADVADEAQDAASSEGSASQDASDAAEQLAGNASTGPNPALARETGADILNAGMSDGQAGTDTAMVGFTRAKRISAPARAARSQSLEELPTEGLDGSGAGPAIESAAEDDEELEASERFLAPIYASAPGLGRLAPNGLRTQTAQVDVRCLRPALVRLLKSVEEKFGKPVLVTSGYRSPARNRAVRGARNSFHLYCAAADIQVAGVSRWELAAYLRSLPGRGGVGTYCHTRSVHIDIGPKRQWNWSCRRRS